MFVRMRQTRDCDLLKHIPKVYYYLMHLVVCFESIHANAMPQACKAGQCQWLLH